MVSANREAFGFEDACHRIALLHRGDVHDSGAFRFAQQAYKALLLGNVSRGVIDLVVQVRAVHPEIERLRRLQPEKARDVLQDAAASRWRSSARTGGRPSACTALPSDRKAGRKSCPHSDTQCASSTTKRSTLIERSVCMNAGSSSRSGVANTKSIAPEP